MHKLERALRAVQHRAILLVKELPGRLSRPLEMILADIPTDLAQGTPYSAITQYKGHINQIPQPMNETKVAIVIQGPISTDHQARLVLESLRIYSSIFPGVAMIVSSWSSSRTLCEKYSLSRWAEIALSDDPGVSFPSNIDRQAQSTFMGLEKASALGATFALKLRTDHRIVDSGALSYLMALWLLKPVDSRIICSSYGSGLYRLYGLTDQLQFGKVDALLNFWKGKPSLYLPDADARGRESLTDFQLRAWCAHEIRLNLRYMLELGESWDYTWSNSCELLTRNFGVADSQSLGHLQLGRRTTVYDHVYPWQDALNNQVEQHTSTAIWLRSLLASDYPAEPNSKVLEHALKVPDSDLVTIREQLKPRN